MSVDVPGEEPLEDESIDRGETAVRALKTLVFFVIARVAQAVLVVVILFELLYVLITQQKPSDAVRRFAERVLAYVVEIVRYLTYNDEDAPFPFREFPPQPEPDEPDRL